MSGAPADITSPGTSPTRAALPAPRILVCVTEDWFALSHFKPLIRALARIAGDVVVVTRSSGRTDEIVALGARVVEFDFRRSSSNPLEGWRIARRLRQLIEREVPDAVHLIALKPIVTGALALALNHRPAVGIHLTGLGLLAIAQSRRQNALRMIALRAMRSLLHRDNAWLFVENEDDLDVAGETVAASRSRATILGGAGVDIGHFTASLQPCNAPPRAAYVGRMIHSKGIDTLIEAMRRLRAQGSALQLDLYGRIDTDNPEAVTERQIHAWESEGLARWHGHVDDVREVWRTTDIFVMATRGGEGMPRAMLEAAACGRPLVVTDVPGCRQFVRNGREGLVSAPEDAAALAAALGNLAADPALRTTMGKAARARVTDGFTEADVEAALTGAYRRLLSL